MRDLFSQLFFCQRFFICCIIRNCCAIFNILSVRAASSFDIFCFNTSIKRELSSLEKEMFFHFAVWIACIRLCAAECALFP